MVSFQMLHNRALPTDLYMYKTMGTNTCYPVWSPLILRTDQNTPFNSLDDFISEIMLFTEIWKHRSTELALQKDEMVYVRIAQKECRGFWIACGFSKNDAWIVWGYISSD